MMTCMKKPPELLSQSKHAVALRRWHQNHPGKMQEYNHTYYVRHRAAMLERSKRDRKAFLQAHPNYNRDRARIRYQDPAYRKYRNQDARRRYWAKTWGLTVQEFAILLIAQDNKCAACHVALKENTGYATGARACLDHNHATGQRRAILCNGCNLAIGYAREEPARLRALAAYLESYASE